MEEAAKVLVLPVAQLPSGSGLVFYKIWILIGQCFPKLYLSTLPSSFALMTPDFFLSKWENAFLKRQIFASEMKSAMVGICCHYLYYLSLPQSPSSD